MSESKLLKSMVIGAVVGATLSMFDRKTREHTIEMAKKFKDTVIYYAQNTDELQKFIQKEWEVAQDCIEKTAENVNVIVDKIDELKEVPSTVQSLVEDTKEAFSHKEEYIN